MLCYIQVEERRSIAAERERERERERRRRGGGELNPQPHTHKAAAAGARETAVRARCGERGARQRRNFARSKPATWRCQSRAGSRNEHRGLPLPLPPLSRAEPSRAAPSRAAEPSPRAPAPPAPAALRTPPRLRAGRSATRTAGGGRETFLLLPHRGGRRSGATASGPTARTAHAAAPARQEGQCRAPRPPPAGAPGRPRPAAAGGKLRRGAAGSPARRVGREAGGRLPTEMPARGGGPPSGLAALPLGKRRGAPAALGPGPALLSPPGAAAGR